MFKKLLPFRGFIIKMNKLHKLTAISYILLIGTFIVFLLIAENNYIGFDNSLQYDVKTKIFNFIFATVLAFNIALSLLSLLSFIVNTIRERTTTALKFILGIYPISIIFCISGFNIDRLLNYLISPLRIIFGI